MKNIFGISFSNRTFDIAHSIKEEAAKLISLQSFKYPFPFNYDTLFLDENIQALAAMINSHKLEKGIDQLALALSLPVNFTFSKRIALPLESEKELITAQVHWELGNYLHGNISDYKIIKKDEIILDTYKEILFMAIKKELFEKISELAGKSNAELAGIKTDSDSILSILKKYYSEQETNNQFVIKIDDKTVNTYIYIAGRYYQSFLDEMNGNPEMLIDVCKERYRLGKEILDTFSSVENKEYNIYIAGSGLDTSLIDMIKDNFKQNLASLKIPEENIDSGSIEAVGVIL